MGIYNRFKEYKGDFSYTVSGTRIVFPKEIFSRIILSLKGNVLDVGTGDGYKLSNILEGCEHNQIQEVKAIDPSPLWKKAKERFEKSRIKVDVFYRSLEDITSDEQFDTILMFEVIEHMLDPDEVLNIVEKLLKPNGTFICSTPNKWVYHIANWIAFRPSDKTHINEMTRKEFVKLINTHFEETVYFNVLPLIMTIGRKFPKLLSLNKYLSFPFVSRATYVFARKVKHY